MTSTTTTPSYTLVATTELAEGDVLHEHGMVLRLQNRRERPDPDGRDSGPIIAFAAVLTNAAEITALAEAGDWTASYVWSCVRAHMAHTRTDVPVWTVQGNRLAQWLREDQ